MVAPTIKRRSDNEVADFLTLHPENPNQAVHFIEQINRPNVDGTAFRKLARKAKPFHVIAMRNFGNLNWARRATVSIRDELVGELCDVETSEGAIYSRVMCLDVTEREVFQIQRLVGGLPAYSGPYFIDEAPSTFAAIAVFDFLFVHAGND